MNKYKPRFVFGWSWNVSLPVSPASLQRNHTYVFISHVSPLNMAIWRMYGWILWKITPYTKVTTTKQRFPPTSASFSLFSVSVWLSAVTSYVPDDGFSALVHQFFFHSLIIESVPPLSSVFLCTAADFSNNQCRLLLLSLKIFCFVKCSEIADSSGEDKFMLTAGLLILHAEKWIKQPVAQRSSVVYDVYFVL